MKKQPQFALLRGERGASLVEMALVLPLFLLLLAGAIDFGRAFYLSMEVVDAAHAAALYGSSVSPNWTDTAGMQAAAQNDAPDVENLNVGTPTYGCECSDGTQYSASCVTIPSCTATAPEVIRVNVTVRGSYTPVIPWPGIPSSISLSSSAEMRSN